MLKQYVHVYSHTLKCYNVVYIFQEIIMSLDFAHKKKNRLTTNGNFDKNSRENSALLGASFELLSLEMSNDEDFLLN